MSDPALIEALVKTASAYPSTRATPSEFVKAVAVRAFSLGLTENDLLLFLKKQTASHPGLSDLLTNRSAYRRLVSSCRAAARSSSPAAAAGNSLKTARLTLGRILSPVPMLGAEQTDLEDGAEVDPKLVPVLTPARQIRARATLAILCVEQLKSIKGEKGWNTLMVSYPWLALRMGASWPTAKAALNDLVDLGWIREVGGHRPDSARRFKISGKLTREQGQVIVAPHLYDAIGSLAGLNDEPVQTAVLVRSVTHTAWTYGDDPLGFRNWLVALARSAGVDPVQLGVQTRSMGRSKKALTRAGLDSLTRPSIGDTTDVMDRLHEWAQGSGSFEAAAQAKELYKAQAAERTDELAVARAIRAQAKIDAERLLGPVTNIPKAGPSRDRMNAWLQGATGVMGRKVLADAQVKAMTRELQARFKARGYEGDTVTRLAGIVVGAAGSLVGPDDSIPAAAAEPSEKQAWLQGMVEKVGGRTLPDDVREVAAKELNAKLKRRGFEKDKAAQLVGIILGEAGTRAA